MLSNSIYIYEKCLNLKKKKGVDTNQNLTYPNFILTVPTNTLKQNLI